MAVSEGRGSEGRGSEGRGVVRSGVRDLLRGLPVFSGVLPEFDPGAAPEDPAELFLEWFSGRSRPGCPSRTR